MTKYEELEKLQKLKESGTITEMEFEQEKQKILNSKVNEENNKIKRSKIFFIITIIGVIITILGVIIYKCYYDNVYYDIAYNDVALYYDDDVTGELGEKHERAEKEYKKVSTILDIIKCGAWVTGGITALMLVTGIVLKVIEKKKNQ